MASKNKGFRELNQPQGVFTYATEQSVLIYCHFKIISQLVASEHHHVSWMACVNKQNRNSGGGRFPLTFAC